MARMSGEYIAGVLSLQHSYQIMVRVCKKPGKSCAERLMPCVLPYHPVLMSAKLDKVLTRVVSKFALFHRCLFNAELKVKIAWSCCTQSFAVMLRKAAR